MLTLNIARLGFATVALLEVLAGAWVSVLRYRRRMLSLQHIYAVQAGRNRCDIIRLPLALITELWVLFALGPLAASNLRARTLPRIFLSDASSTCTASVVADTSYELAAELRRHCLARGTWSKLLIPVEGFSREHAELLEEDEVPSGVPLVCHPIWVLLSEILQYRLLHRRVQRRRQHINLLEVRAVLEFEQRLSRSHSNVRRYLLGVDSQVCLAAVLKGRSASPRINALLRESLAVHIGSGLYGEYGFVPSRSNVADDPTRSTRIRQPSENCPDWWGPAWSGDFRGLDAWLSQLGFDPLDVAGFPFSTSEDKSTSAVRDHLDHLRSVQKPDRLKRFDEKLFQELNESEFHVQGQILGALAFPKRSPPRTPHNVSSRPSASGSSFTAVGSADPIHASPPESKNKSLSAKKI